MKTIITKTICEMSNGDRKISRERVLISVDLESYRKQVQKVNPNCSFVRFVYEEFSN